MVQESNVRLWSRKMRPQDLKSQIVTSEFKVANVDYARIRIKHKTLKNDKNIHIKGLKNDNFWDNTMSKFSTNDKWRIKNIINKKVVGKMVGWKYILKH